MYVAAASASAFGSTSTGDYEKGNYTGPNRVILYDTSRNSLIADIDLTPAQEAFMKKTKGQRTSGFQDLAEDSSGNSYVIGTFGNSIAKISANKREVSLWYYPQNYTKNYGFGGIFSHNDKLIISDLVSHGFVVFDTKSQVRLGQTPQPKEVPLQGLPSGYSPPSSDGLLAPRKYGGRIALWSDDVNGTSVYGSNDGWETAMYLGLVPNDHPAAAGSLSTATFEIGESIFSLPTFFQFTLPFQTRKSFPFIDITEAVSEIVLQSNIFVGNQTCERP